MGVKKAEAGCLVISSSIVGAVPPRRAAAEPTNSRLLLEIHQWKRRKSCKENPVSSEETSGAPNNEMNRRSSPLDYL